MQQDILMIFEAIQQASLQIYEILKKSLGEYTQNTNSTGDIQLQADVESDRVIEALFQKLPCVKQICSEEQDNIKEFHKEGIYSIAYDPLDGSSLMGANLSVGSIFGIYKGDFLPQNLIGAAYVIYGMVIGIGLALQNQEGVAYYTYDGKDFKLQKTLKLNSRGKLNSPGGTQKDWDSNHKAKIENLFAQGYRLRYSGGMVPDLHHILVKGGGIFSYPATQNAPKGKLRMLFEVFPFAFIFEKAGGEAKNPAQRLLELTPSHLHDTCACYFGSKEEMKYVCS